MSSRIIVTIRDTNGNVIISQANNQEGKPLQELEGDALDRQAYKLIERTAWRHSPNCSLVITEVKPKGKNAGVHGLLTRKVRGAGNTDGQVRLFAKPQKVTVSFEVDGKAIIPALASAVSTEDDAAPAAAPTQG